MAVALLTFCGAAQTATYTIIEPPGATYSSALGINDHGDALGYFHTNNEDRGYVRRADGTYVTLPLADVSGINNKRWVTGELPPGRGFILKPNGHIVKFGNDAYQALYAADINALGSVCGYFTDEQGLRHSFLRTVDGTFTVFDAPGAGPLGTSAAGINDSDVVIGSFVDDSDLTRGFIRAADGTMTTFDYPGQTDTEPSGINAAGVIVGQYGPYGEAHGFIRDAAGALTSFDPPNLADYFLWLGINDKGVIAGSYVFDTGYQFSAFIRKPDGKIKTIDYPGTTNATWILSLNRKGDVVGSFLDNAGLPHAYLRTP